MPPKRLHRKTIYQSPWVSLHLDRVEMPSGHIIEEYHFLNFPSEGVMIVVTNKKNEICMIKSPRYPTQTLEWEIPGGLMDEEEKPEETAEREVWEETGYKIKNMRTVYSCHPLNSFSDKRVHTIFAELASEEQSDFDINEVSEVRWFTDEEVKKMIRNQEISDGQSLLALLLYFNQKS